MRHKERGGGIGSFSFLTWAVWWVGEVMGTLLDVFISGDPEAHDR